MTTKEEFAKALFDLRSNNIKTIRIDYSGGGDSGAIDNITFIDTDDDIRSILQDDTISVVENISYRMLDDIEDWWNNDGGDGTLIINVNDLSYNIENNIRYTEHQTYNHDGDVSEYIEQ
jgi:Fe-S cluster assembly iron-binding protein IscA